MTAGLRRTAGFALVVLLSASVSEAQTLSGTLEATITLTSSCIITGDTSTSGANFGTLDFGSHPGTFVGQVTATAANGAGGAGTTELTCSPDVTDIAVSVDAGLHAGQGSSVGTGARALASTAPAYLPYDVFADAAHTVHYPTTGATLPVAVPTPGASFALPVFGLINKTSAAALASGVYSDTLTITITF